jgi:hypothetical protein
MVQPLQRFFGETAIGGDLASEDRQQRQPSGASNSNIIARRGLGFTGAIVIQRPHAGIGPHHVFRLHRLGEIIVHRLAEIAISSADALTLDGSPS